MHSIYFVPSYFKMCSFWSLVWAYVNVDLQGTELTFILVLIAHVEEQLSYYVYICF